MFRNTFSLLETGNRNTHSSLRIPEVPSLTYDIPIPKYECFPFACYLQSFLLHSKGRSSGRAAKLSRFINVLKWKFALKSSREMIDCIFILLRETLQKNPMSYDLIKIKLNHQSFSLMKGTYTKLIPILWIIFYINK